MLSPDQQNVVDDLGAEVGMAISRDMRPYAVECPERYCAAPVGTCCMTAGGQTRDEPHSSRIRLVTRRHGRV